MRSLNQSGLNRARRLSRILSPCVSAVEQLESRIVLNATLVSQVPSQFLPGAAQTVNLATYFNDPTVTGTAVDLQTSQGSVPLVLTDSATPNTVANFLSYISSGEFANTIFHRTVPGFILQGGGYTTSGTHIALSGKTLLGESATATLKNTTGTIAMALSNGPDTATSEWFINLVNNAGLDNTSDGGPFTAFGQVAYNGMSVINAIANLGEVDASAENSAWNTLPVNSNYSGQTAVPPTTLPAATNPVPAADLVTINPIVIPGGLTFTVTSSDPSIVATSTSGESLTLTPGVNTGQATVTVQATDLGGNVASTTFSVAVGTLPQVQVPLGTLAHEVRFKDPNGTNAAAFLTGAGGGTVTLTGVGLSQSTSKAGVVTVSGIPNSIAIDATGTTSSTTLNVQSLSGRPIFISEISSDGDLRSLSAGHVALQGNVTIGGSVTNISMDTESGGIITINGSSGAVALVLGTNGGENVTSSEAIASIQATSWTASPTINAPSIGRINIAGQIDANITAGSLGPVTAGIIGSSTWTISGVVSNITAGGINALNLSGSSFGRITSRQAINNSNLVSQGNITSVAAAVLTESKIDAGGITLGSNGIPTAFTSPATINSVVVGHGGFSDSVIFAQTLGTLNLANVSTDTSFAVAGGEILSLAATIDGKRLSLKKVTSQEQVTAALTKSNITAEVEIDVVTST